MCMCVHVITDIHVQVSQHIQMRQKVAEANERIRKAETDREVAESAVLTVSFLIPCVTYPSLSIHRPAS